MLNARQPLGRDTYVMFWCDQCRLGDTTAGLGVRINLILSGLSKIMNRNDSFNFRAAANSQTRKLTLELHDPQFTLKAKT